MEAQGLRPGNKSRVAEVLPLLYLHGLSSSDLAGQMDNDAAQIEQVRGKLTSALESTEWVGPTKSALVGEWNSTHKTSPLPSQTVPRRGQRAP